MIRQNTLIFPGYADIYPGIVLKRVDSIIIENHGDAFIALMMVDGVSTWGRITGMPEGG